jgi:uncharacterized cofD-like protein
MNLKIVAMGGGGGATQVLKAAQPLGAELTAIIAVTDTGRSTGLARAIGDIPAPGDLRATIASFASDPVMAELLQHRFSGAGIPQLEGMAFGNLLIAALAQVRGDFGAAVEQVQSMVGCQVTVLPVSNANTQLCAELADGSTREGELHVRGLQKPAIKRLYLREDSPASPAALAAIAEADLVVLGPGSLFTTLLPSLLFTGMREALAASKAKVAYICNTTTQPGQTDGYSALNHVQRVIEYLGDGVLDVAIVNESSPDPAALQKYEAEGLFLLRPDKQERADLQALGPQVLFRNLTEAIGEKRALWNKMDTVRHDPAALQLVLAEIAADL